MAQRQWTDSKGYSHTMVYADVIDKRLDYLRKEIQAERISYAEICELESLADYIAPDDIELLQWANPDEEIET